MGTSGNSGVIIRIKPSPVDGPDCYRVLGPGIDLVVTGGPAATERAQAVAESLPDGATVMAVDAVGLAVWTRYFAAAGRPLPAAPPPAPPPPAAPAPPPPSPHTSMPTPTASGQGSSGPAEGPATVGQGAFGSAAEPTIVNVETPNVGVYWHTAETYETPYTEIDGIRFRRASGGWLGMEVNYPPTGGWIRWWVFTEQPNPFALLSLADDMDDALALATCAAGTLGAKVLEQYGAEVTALVRYGAARIDGVSLIAPAVALGRRTGMPALLVSAIEAPAQAAAIAWVQSSAPVVAAVHRVVQACGDVSTVMQQLSVQQRRALQVGSGGGWRERLRTGAEVSEDVQKIFDTLKSGLDLLSSAELFGG